MAPPQVGSPESDGERASWRRTRAYLQRAWSQRVVRAAALLTLLAVVGTLGYMRIEGWAPLDSLFMAVSILSTVGGVGESRPLTPTGRAFTILLIITGVTVAAYVVSVIGEYVTGGVLTGLFRRRRVDGVVKRYRGHYIVCGNGRVGRQIVADLGRRGVDVVVIESRPMAATDAPAEAPVIVGDAADDATLIRAGIQHAHGIVAATGSDSTNLVIVLSARSLDPDVLIVARASESSAEKKMMLAGADHVVSPYAIGGHRVASELLSPGISDFIDTVIHAEHDDLWLDVTTVAPDSPLVGKTVAELLQPGRSGTNLVALKGAGDTTFLTNPDQRRRIGALDTLVAAGPQIAVRRLAAQAEGSGRAGADGRRRVRGATIRRGAR